MLELRPICENYNRPLPPESTQAMIYTFECTFCKDCVTNVLHNVCPNCGGGFSPRPIRPKKNWKGENFLGKYPAHQKIKHRPVNTAAHKEFSSKIRRIAPKDR
ncbi:MAG TPA: DUF1272 domain-containing protein [Gammaproteobacteria bacterium]